MVPPDSDRDPPTPPYSGYGPGRRGLRVRGSHPLRRALPGRFRSPDGGPIGPPCNPRRASTPRVWAGPLSLAATRGVTLVFLSSGYLDVSVRRVRLRLTADAAPARGGLPHSDTRGSTAARASPRTFAACRVLHRLREPRHPPRALLRFPQRGGPPAGGTVTARGARPLTGTGRRRPHGPGRAARRPLAGRARRIVSLAFLPACQRTGPRDKARANGVEDVGLEPTTPGLQSRCPSRLSQSPGKRSPGQARTAGLHIISVAL